MEQHSVNDAAGAGEGAIDPRAARPARRRRLLIRCVAGILGLVVMGAVFVHFGLVFYLDRHMPHYVEVGADTIYMVEKTLYNPESKQEIVLIGMAHLGDQAFYDAVNERLAGDGLVLWEGVTDDLELLGAGSGNPYGALGGAIGLAMQQRFDVPPERMVWGDVDVTALSPESIKVLRILFSVLAAPRDRESVRANLDRLAQVEADATGVEGRVMTDLIQTRNLHLLEVIDAHTRAPRLFIPWGAWHMPGLEAALAERGFVIQREQRRPITTLTRIYSGVCRALMRARD